jgi:hypothetical protein
MKMRQKKASGTPGRLRCLAWCHPA